MHKHEHSQQQQQNGKHHHAHQNQTPGARPCAPEFCWSIHEVINNRANSFYRAGWIPSRASDPSGGLFCADYGGIGCISSPFSTLLLQ